METSNLDLTPVDPQDVEQEAELLRLQGINPHKGIIWKRLAHKEAIYDEIPSGASLLWSDEPYPDPLVTEELVKWAMGQSEAISEVIFNFLESPSDEGVDEVTQQLKSLGVDLFSREVKKEKSLTQIILELLEKKAYSLVELYEIGRALQPSNRPEAAVRQIMRRLTREDRVKLMGELFMLVDHG